MTTLVEVDDADDAVELCMCAFDIDIENESDAEWVCNNNNWSNPCIVMTRVNASRILDDGRSEDDSDDDDDDDNDNDDEYDALCTNRKSLKLSIG